MPTPAQLTTLAADIAANAAVISGGQFNGTAVQNVPHTSDGAFAVAAWYNLAASPDFWVWRFTVSKDEYVGSTSVDGTTFSWVGAGYITRSQGERDAFIALFDAKGYANPSLASVRQAFSDIFSGATAPAPANRTHLTTVSRRKATRLEKLFAAGTGSTASPATMALEGPLATNDVQLAWGI